MSRIDELRKRITVSTTPRIEMLVADIAAFLDVAEAARALRDTTGLGGKLEAVYAALARLDGGK